MVLCSLQKNLISVEKPEVYHQQTPELSLKDSTKHLARNGGSENQMWFDMFL